VLERGPFVIAAVVDESSSTAPLTLNGTFIDLFSSELPVMKQKVIKPGTQGYLFDIDKIRNRQKPQVLATAARVSDEVIANGQFTFVAKSPAKTSNVMRIMLPAKPRNITAQISSHALTLTKRDWDESSQTLLLGFENYSEGVEVKITW
jgi:hypothetical protein